MAMEVEESIRANPIDGVVLLAGCDKTTPAMLMGAASVDIPTVLLSGGPMLNGKVNTLLEYLLQFNYSNVNVVLRKRYWIRHRCLEIQR